MRRFRVKSSLKNKTLTATAITGSKAPIIAVGVEPISCIANTKATLDTKVVTKAKITKLKKMEELGISKLSFKMKDFSKK